MWECVCSCDAHCDSRHRALKTFACPNEACTACFGLKGSLLYHLEFVCGENVKGSAAAAAAAAARKKQAAAAGEGKNFT